MRGRLWTAWLSGCALLALATILVFLCIRMGVDAKFSAPLEWSPALAAALVAWRAQRRRVLLGTSMCLPTAAFALALNSIEQATGHAVDFPGLRGAETLAVVTLGWSAFLCLVTSAAVYLLIKAIRAVQPAR